jgi:hypothetical protein
LIFEYETTGEGDFVGVACAAPDATTSTMFARWIAHPLALGLAARALVFAVLSHVGAVRRHTTQCGQTLLGARRIAAGAAVLKGVTIGENSVTAFGSVVVKDIPANVIAGGNPCKEIGDVPE